MILATLKRPEGACYYWSNVMTEGDSVVTPWMTVAAPSIPIIFNLEIEESKMLYEELKSYGVITEEIEIKDLSSVTPYGGLLQ